MRFRAVSTIVGTSCQAITFILKENRMSFKRIVVLFHFIALCAASPAIGQAPRYRITDLGTIAGPASFALAINKEGVSTGWSSINFTNNQTHAFSALYGPMVDLGSPAGFRT